MVQILPRQPSTFEKIMGPLSEGFGNVAEGLVQRQKQQTQKTENEQRSKALVALGIPEMVAKEAVRNPDIMKSILDNQMLEERAAKIMGETPSSRILGTSDTTPPQNNSFEGISEEGSAKPMAKKPKGLQAKTDEQLIALSGIKGYSEPAKQELKRRQEEAKLTQKNEQENIKRSEANFDKAYKYNEPFINEVTSKYQAFESETKPRLMYLQKEATNENLIGPTAAAFLESMGIPLGALENPNSEVYQKLSQDLLKGLPESYGSRILKVEVDNFLKTIPTLLNSPEGRRMIASNMLKLNEMKEVFYNEMRKQQKQAIKENKFPIDFQQNVLDAVKPQLDRINSEFAKMSEITSVPPGTSPWFGPGGEIFFVPKDQEQWAIDNGGKRVW